MLHIHKNIDFTVAAGGFVKIVSQKLNLHRQGQFR